MLGGGRGGYGVCGDDYGVCGDGCGVCGNRGDCCRRRTQILQTLS